LTTGTRGTQGQFRAGSSHFPVGVEFLGCLAMRVPAELGERPLESGRYDTLAIERSDPGEPQKKKAYGPYYQWTYKRGGKTVMVNLSASQAKTYQRAIDRHRELEATTEKMRELSLAVLEQRTKGVAKLRLMA